MSVDIVQAEYEGLETIADRFLGHAEVITELCRGIEKSVQALREGWQGKGAAAFFAEMEQVIFPALRRLGYALREAQSVTLQIKALLEEAELAAAAPFQSTASRLGEQPFKQAHRIAEMNEFSPLVAGLQDNVAGLGMVVSSLLKGVAADALVPQRYILRALTPNAARGQTTVAALMDMLAGKPGRGLPLIRFDGPHPGMPNPHLNLELKLLDINRHISISPRLLNIAGKGTRLLEGMQKIALPLAITVDVFRLGSAFKQDNYEVGSSTKPAIGSVVGGWTGAMAGAKAGAVGGAWLGGVVGSAFPVVGTAVGAGVGGFLGGLGGGIGGGLGGSWVGEKLGGLV